LNKQLCPKDVYNISDSPPHPGYGNYALIYYDISYAYDSNVSPIILTPT